MKKLKQKRQYKVYPCRICGRDMRDLSNPHKRRYCSEGCQSVHTESLREEFDCAICGLHVKRLRSRSSNAKAKVCSLQCQAKWRNKLSPISTPKWDRRSEKAKDRYKKMSRRLRQQKYRPIIEAIGRLEERVKYRQIGESWLVSISQRLGYQRAVYSKSQKQKTKGGVSGAILRFESRIRYRTLNPWKKAIYSKIKTAFRRSESNEDKIRSQENSNGYLCETRAKPIQMRFNWMEDHAE